MPVGRTKEIEHASKARGIYSLEIHEHKDRYFDQTRGGSGVPAQRSETPLYVQTYLTLGFESLRVGSNSKDY